MEIAEALTTALADTAVRVEELRAELADLETERRGLQLALARYQRESAPDPAQGRAETAAAPPAAAQPPPPHTPVPPVETPTARPAAVGLSNAVLRTLADAGVALSPVDVVERLRSAGWDANGEQVRAALSYLRNRRKTVRRLSQGQYVAADGSTADDTIDTESPMSSDTGLSVLTGSATEGGGANGTGPIRVHDEGSSGEASHRVHNHGAPVGG